MKNNSSFNQGSLGSRFALSAPVIMENFKLSWYIPVLTMIAFFTGTILPIITNLPNLEPYDKFQVSQILNLQNALFWLGMIGIPLVASVVMMNYSHVQAKAVTLSAQPFSRHRLFNSHLVSGWLMFMIPLIITGILLIPFINPVNAVADYGSIYYDMNGEAIYSKAEYTDILTIKSIFMWLFCMTAVMTFFYGLFCFAGSITGTSTMHVLLSGLLFMIVAIVYSLIDKYCTAFIPGFMGLPSWMEELVCKSNPAVEILAYGDAGIAPKVALLFLAEGVLLIVLSAILHGALKFERIGDSIPFRITEEIITVLLVFIGMSMFGFFFNAINGSKAFFVLGVIIGIAVTFFIVKVIIARSVKVFNRSNLISLIACFVLAAVFCLFTVFDITGYATKMPDESRIQSVEAVDVVDGYSEYTFSSAIRESIEWPTEVPMDSQLAGSIYDLQKYVIDNQLYDMPDNNLNRYNILWSGPIDETNEIPFVALNFTYKLNSGNYYQRHYNVLVTDELVDKLSVIVDSDEYKELVQIPDELSGLLKYGEVTVLDSKYFNYNASDVLTTTDPEFFKGILNAYNKDICNSSLKERISTGSYTVSESCLCYVYMNGSTDSRSISFDIYESYENTMEFLKDYLKNNK